MKAGKKVGMVSIVAVAVFMGAQTSVALPKIKVPAVAGGGESASGMDITQMKADLESKTAESVKQCSAARVAFVDAQLLLCEALGLKADQATKLAEAKTLAEGNASAGDLKKAQVISQAANEAIKKASAEAGEMAPDAKQKYAEGISKFASGLTMETAQIAVIAELAKTAQDIAQNASGLEKAGAIAAGKPALALAAMVPADVKEATGTLGSIISVAKKQNIAVPKDATSLLGD